MATVSVDVGSQRWSRHATSDTDDPAAAEEHSTPSANSSSASRCPPTPQPACSMLDIAATARASRHLTLIQGRN